MEVFDKDLNRIVTIKTFSVPHKMLDGVPITKKQAELMLETQIRTENYEVCACIEKHINKFDKNGIALKYYCDNKRHLVCTPYLKENLHKMAENLNIKRCWFHKDHYDIPKRRIKEIMAKCTVVNSNIIVKIKNLQRLVD